MQNKVSRVLHIKKEKSRNAARSRRGKENYEFYELAKLLPISSDTSSQLDKASIVRLTMNYLQLQNFIKSTFGLDKYHHACIRKQCLSIYNDSSLYISKNLGSLLLQSLDGFVFILNEDGRFLYVSNSVSECLGLPQVDLMGTKIYNYVHPTDHVEVENHLQNKCTSANNDEEQRFCIKNSSENKCGRSTCSFFIRMKSTLSRRGIGIKSSGYKVLHITGRICLNENDASLKSDAQVSGFTGVAQILPPPSLMDIQSDLSSFVSRLNPGLFFKYCEERVDSLVGYSADEVKGHSLYEFVHFADISAIQHCHKEVLSKGQVVTPYYRWLTKDGSYVWLQSCGTLIADRPQDGEEEAFIWINYLIGNDEKLFLKEREEEVVNGGDSPKTTPKEEPTSDDQTEDSKNTRKRPLVKLGNQVKKGHNKRVKVTETTKICHLNPILTGLVSPSKSEGLTKHCKDAETCCLDHESKLWFNPPNKEINNQQDLPPGVKVSKCSNVASFLPSHAIPSVIHHYYPFGINPNILSSNPLLAKMLSHHGLERKPLFCPPTIYTSPLINIMTPVISTIVPPQTTLPHQLNCSPDSIAMMLDELRKDPLRKVSPPNKVVLPSLKQSPKDLYESDDGDDNDSSQTRISSSSITSLSTIDVDGFQCNKYFAKLMFAQLFK